MDFPEAMTVSSSGVLCDGDEMLEADRDIYPWYEEPRWFAQVFKKDPIVGRRILHRYSFMGSRTYFRPSYASLRVNGFEYGRLNPDGSFRYGQQNWRLDPAECSPGELVTALGKMFEKLAESSGDSRGIPAWANATFPTKLAEFITYAAVNHQPEHWLESRLLLDVSVLCETYDSGRSQVVVGYVGKRGWKFIDMLVLDRRHKELVVIELKVPQADGRAVTQIAAYTQWVEDNKELLLSPAYDYAPNVQQPSEFRVAAAFVAPRFAANFTDYVRKHLAGFPTRLFVADSEWRKEIKVEEMTLSEFTNEKEYHMPKITSGKNDSAAGVSLGRGRDDLRRRLLEEAKAQGLQLRRISQFEYDDLDSSSGEVVAQIHTHSERADGLILVRARKDCGRVVHVLEQCIIGDRELSGDRGPNRNWLRGNKPYHNKGPSAIFWVPVDLANQPADHPSWKDVRQILRSATWLLDSRKRMTDSALIITHGDVDGMVCAAQLIRRERDNCQVVFSNARWIARKLGAVLRSQETPRRVYVTDIPADAQAATFAAQLTDAGTDVCWVDHHPWADGLVAQMKAICTRLVYNEAMSTPAGILLGQWLGEEDPFSRQIASICYAYETGTEWQRDWFRLLSSCIGKAGRPILDRLAFDQPFTEEDLQAIQRQADADRAAETMLSAKPLVFRTATGRAVAVYDTSDKPGVFLGRKVFEHHEVDYSLVRISGRKWQLAARPEVHLPLDKLMGSHDLEGMRISVAGRPNRLLSIEVSAQKTAPLDAHERIIDFVADKNLL
jgi:hypothetical protein